MKINDNTDIAGILQNALASLMPGLRGATTDPRDELIVRYTRGKGRFSADKRFITLDMKMFTLDGKEDGIHQGVWEAQFTSPQDLLRVPPMPTGPMDVPVGPVPHIGAMAQTKAIWRFTDGSSITVAGPAVSHLIPLQDGSSIFVVSTAQMLSVGTGRYKGAVGVNQSLGTTFVPKGLDLFGAGTPHFDVATLDTFKVVRSRYNRPFPGTGTDALAPEPGA